MDVASWLRSLGLEQYEATFRDNAIDDSVLPDLTDQDLEKLGILLGHRRKLLRAIANIDATAQTASSAVGATVAVDVSPRDTAERRQVTVMFSDLVGSTALSARMDPEDLREVISAYQKCVAETVQRFGGFVAKYMGDGVLVYFGYPQAHEDDAERAVRAGLELVAAVGALKTHAPLQTRVGIATGLVVVGDLIGSGASQEQAIVGETPNLAARLQGIAEPNSVVIAESTRKLVGNLFELEDLGAQDLKGIAGPVRAWAALRPTSVESRFDALHAGVTCAAAIATAALVATAVVSSRAQEVSQAIDIGDSDLGGVVTGPAGPEAGVWVITETSDLATKFAKVVVTDERGRYVIPDLPKANYSIWVRGCGLVDSAKVQSTPGKLVNLLAVPAPTAAAAAEYYPGVYWYALLKIPAASEFPGTGDKGNGIGEVIKTQHAWIDTLKNSCQSCHALGSKGVRTLSKNSGNSAIRPRHGRGAFSRDKPCPTCSARSRGSDQTKR